MSAALVMTSAVQAAQLRKPLLASPHAGWVSENASWLVQELQQPPEEGPTAAIVLAHQAFTVHGVVLNAATGEPLPRALVKVENENTLGALTDGQGQFEISGVPGGIQTFDVVKPGFRAEVETTDYVIPASHTVRVAPNMPALSFSISPANAISGQVVLSTGDPGVGINTVLLRQTIQDGRATWTESSSEQTNTEGEFRFAGLEDGSYLIMTKPSFENEGASAPARAGRAPTRMPGYPAVYYANAVDPAGATRIQVSGGQQARANLLLALTGFHAVTASLIKAPPSASWQFTAALLDRNGQSLDYPLRYDEKARTVHAYLPDGTYLLTVSGSPGGDGEQENAPPRPAPIARDLSGLIEFSVSGHPETSLAIPLASGVTTPVRVRFQPAPPAAARPGAQGENDRAPEQEGPLLGLWMTRAGGVPMRVEGRVDADWAGTDLFQLEAAPPGSYWVRASANRSGTCLGAVTAGGVNLARTPLLVGPSGAGASIDVEVRTDCAKLNLQIPSTLLGETAGEVPALYVYVIPEFESTASLVASVIRPSDESFQTLDDLTPGPYRVLVFDRPHALEYQNAAAMESLAGQGQSVTLSPGATANLMLEGPRH